MELDTYLCFTQGQHTYAIENHVVLRILPKVHISNLPVQVGGLRGLLLSEDILMAIIDVEELMFHTNSNKERYYIVVDFHGEHIGICASEIKETRQINEQDWQPCDYEELAFSYKDEGTEIFHLQLDLLQRR